MRFYGIGYESVMMLPVRVFWHMSSCVDRLRAEEDQRSFRVANNAQGGEGIEEYLEHLNSSVGKVFVVDPIIVAVKDEAGFNELRSMALEKQN